MKNEETLTPDDVEYLLRCLMLGDSFEGYQRSEIYFAMVHEGKHPSSNMYARDLITDGNRKTVSAKAKRLLKEYEDERSE
jgi:hypothetical protein